MLEWNFKMKTINKLLNFFGYALIPYSEIESMYRDGEIYGNIHPAENERLSGYFNGLGDYASKKSMILDEKYYQ